MKRLWLVMLGLLALSNGPAAAQTPRPEALLWLLFHGVLFPTARTVVTEHASPLCADVRCELGYEGLG